MHCSLLASGQVSPKQGHEKALRALLRYLNSDMNVAQAFPAGDDPDPFGESFEVLSGKLVVYSDAAFAPMRALQRRSISGCVIMYSGCLIKAFARHQASVTLSSCEAELAAIQGAVQEAIGIQKTLKFVVKKDLTIELRTDSMSGKQLLEASDVQRRSRHRMAPRSHEFRAAIFDVCARRSESGRYAPEVFAFSRSAQVQRSLGV